LIEAKILTSYARISVATFLIFSLYGCASITSSPSQTIQLIAVNANDEPIDNVLCILINSYGRWSVMAPGAVVVGRSNENMNVTCSREDGWSGSSQIRSNFRTVAVGNVLVGGVVGLAVDHISGSAYEFPSHLKVVLYRIK
jgi:hypothetical protein